MCCGLWADIKANYIKSAKIALAHFTHTHITMMIMTTMRNAPRFDFRRRFFLFRSFWSFMQITDRRHNRPSNLRVNWKYSQCRWLKYKFVNMLILCNYIDDGKTCFFFCVSSPSLFLLTSRVMCEHINAPVFHKFSPHTHRRCIDSRTLQSKTKMKYII